jgi:hypothetical protein
MGLKIREYDSKKELYKVKSVLIKSLPVCETSKSKGREEEEDAGATEPGQDQPGQDQATVAVTKLHSADGYKEGIAQAKQVCARKKRSAKKQVCARKKRSKRRSKCVRGRKSQAEKQVCARKKKLKRRSKCARKKAEAEKQVLKLKEESSSKEANDREKISF